MNKTKYIAFVCTGNTCRSPMAEGIFNDIAKEKCINVRAESFGINTVTGADVSEKSKLVCQEINIDISALTATAVGDADLSKYDAFYCMSNEHAQILNLYYKVDAEKIFVLNISDPYGGDVDIYRNCRDEIYNSIKEIISQVK